MKKFLMLTMSLLIAVPTYAITQEQAAQELHRLINVPADPEVQSCIARAAQLIAMDDSMRSDNAKFMSGLAECLASLLHTSLQGIRNGMTLATQIHFNLMKDYEWNIAKPNHIDWADIDHKNLRTGCFAGYAPSYARPRFMKMFDEIGEPRVQATTDPNGTRMPVLTPAYALSAITFARQILHQVDTVLAIGEKLLTNPASGLAALSSLASN